MNRMAHPSQLHRERVVVSFAVANDRFPQTSESSMASSPNSSSRGIVSVAAVVFWSSLTLMQAACGQAAAKTPELYFYASPRNQLFSLGENVTIDLEFWSRSEQALYVSRLQNGAFVTFKVIGPDGHEVPWKNGRGDGRKYLPSDFTVLKQYTGLKADRIISPKDGEGFAFDKPGQYSLTAEFSMNPSNRFTEAAGRAKPPVGVFQSKASFCIEVCISEPLLVLNNAPQSSLGAVRAFYNLITRYQQLGIPDGREKKALRPLLSKRLAHLLDNLQECDDDYYRRFGDILRANTYKPSTPWLEAGLFTGPNDAATPRLFRMGRNRSVGNNRVDVELIYTVPEMNCRDKSPCSDHFRGVVTTILENNRWVIDDYVAMYENDHLQRLSAGYPECKDNHWVGEGP
jgi:hypothetical protein